MTDNKRFFANMPTRQKIISIGFILVIIVLFWQIAGLFGDEEATPSAPQMAQTPGAPSAAAPIETPVSASLPPQTPREAELFKQQKELETKYVATVNELQMLKLQREIAETNKAIVDANLGTVTAQKNIVTLLSPVPAPQVSQGAYAQGLAGGTVPAQMASVTKAETEVSYSVISISQLKNKWNAVIGYQTNLYNVSVGDILPPDGSTVVSINRSGVILEKEGVRRKVSLVPII